MVREIFGTVAKMQQQAAGNPQGTLHSLAITLIHSRSTSKQTMRSTQQPISIGARNQENERKSVADDGALKC